MKFRLKNSSKWAIIALIPILAACGNQGSTVNTELAVPVSVTDVTKKSIVQYINTTGTATAASQTTLSTEMAGIYRIGKNPKTGADYKFPCSS